MHPQVPSNANQSRFLSAESGFSLISLLVATSLLGLLIAISSHAFLTMQRLQQSSSAGISASSDLQTISKMLRQVIKYHSPDGVTVASHHRASFNVKNKSGTTTAYTFETICNAHSLDTDYEDLQRIHFSSYCGLDPLCPRQQRPHIKMTATESGSTARSYYFPPLASSGFSRTTVLAAAICFDYPTDSATKVLSFDTFTGYLGANSKTLWRQTRANMPLETDFYTDIIYFK